MCNTPITKLLGEHSDRRSSVDILLRIRSPTHSLLRALLSKFTFLAALYVVYSACNLFMTTAWRHRCQRNARRWKTESDRHKTMIIHCSENSEREINSTALGEKKKKKSSADHLFPQLTCGMVKGNCTALSPWVGSGNTVHVSRLFSVDTTWPWFGEMIHSQLISGSRIDYNSNKRGKKTTLQEIARG